MATTLNTNPTPRRRLGRTSIGAPDGPPADYAGPAADPITEIVEEAGFDGELEQLVAEQAADAEADGIAFGEPVTADDERPTTGLYEPVTWELSATGDTENFAKAPKLTELAMRLIESQDEFKHLRKFKFLILWKAKGGTRAQEPVIARASLLGGIARYQAGAHFLITFAADHCHDMRLTDDQYEWAMHHELCHCWRTVNDDGTEKPTIRHGIEVFPSELTRYGIWRADLQRVKDAMSQQTLWESDNQMAEGVL